MTATYAEPAATSNLTELLADTAPHARDVSGRVTALLDAIVVAAVAFGSIAGAAAWAMSSGVDPTEPDRSA